MTLICLVPIGYLVKGVALDRLRVLTNIILSLIIVTFITINYPCMSDSQPVSTQSSRQSNVDLVIDAVARGEFDRGDEFNYYSSQNTTASSSTDRRHSHNGTDDHTN